MKSGYEFVEKIADSIIRLSVPLSKNKAFIPSGINGPYFNLETPIRNSAHSLIIFCVLCRIENDPRYRDMAEKLLNFLLEPGVFYQEGTFVQRQKEGADLTNGVIGQAWVLEALSIASECLESNPAKEKALTVDSSLFFNSRIGAWESPSLGHYKARIDYTLNHQLWYAAAKAETYKDDNNRDIEHFLTKLNQGAMRIRDSGLICHLFHSNSFRGLLLQGRYNFLEKRNRSAVREKEIGYHLYNLYPLARLRRYYPNHDLFQNEMLKKSLNFSLTEEFKGELKSNKYSYPYNSPAFEFPLILNSFKDLINSHSAKANGEELDYQLEYTFDEATGILSKNNPDPLTLTSRVYELAISYL